MKIAEQIRTKWAVRQKELEMVWWLLPQWGQGDLAEDVATKLQARITACLLMSPFAPESGREVGKQLADQFKFHMEKLGQLQGLLAEQLLAELDTEQVAWLIPRLMTFWAEMTVGYGLVLQELYISEQAAWQEKIMHENQQLVEKATESEQRFKALFEKTYSPVLIHENGRILASNKAVTKVFGYAAEELIGKQIQSLIYTLTPMPEQAKILGRIQAEYREPYQSQCYKLDGTTVDVEIIPQQFLHEDRLVDVVILRPLDESLFLPAGNLEEVNFSPQQEAVLRHMTTGLTYKEIAEELQISLPTVHYHKQKIFEKLQVETRVEAIMKALQMKSKK